MKQFLNGLTPHGAGSWSRKTFKRLPIDIEPLFGRDLDWCLVPDRSRFQYVSIYTRINIINSIVSRVDNKCLHGHHKWNGSRKIPNRQVFFGVSGYSSAKNKAIFAASYYPHHYFMFVDA